MNLTDLFNIIDFAIALELLLVAIIIIYFIVLLCCVIKISKNTKNNKKELEELRKEIAKNQELNQLYFKQYVVLLNKISDSLSESDEPYIIAKED